MTGKNSPQRRRNNPQCTDTTASVSAPRALCVSVGKNRAEQSQLGEESQCAKQSQYPLSTGAGGDGRGRRRSRRWGRLYKQTQFAPHRPEKALAGRLGSATGGETDRAKQSQFRRSNGDGKYRREKELRALSSAESLDKTKPIAAQGTMDKGHQGCQWRGQDPSCETKPIGCGADPCQPLLRKEVEREPMQS